jgi:hypothetical protein
LAAARYFRPLASRKTLLIRRIRQTFSAQRKCLDALFAQSSEFFFQLVKIFVSDWFTIGKIFQKNAIKDANLLNLPIGKILPRVS